ncbi:MAG: serine/threonine protein kinase [Deltaproteobacteria bacterium]|nr:serine/threonine protein kinase [Deltaproteobacteria bacterium]
MSESKPETENVVTIGRYALHRQIARGGMATIHMARLVGDEGFSRIVAAKRLLPEFAEDAEFVAMFLDEARIASKVHHQNVVPVLDLVTQNGEVVLVQEYVHGVPLSWLASRARHTKTRIPVRIAVALACQTLAGLHAAHETVDELGMPLEIVHRDVSPQNVMVASDGTARLLDFGVAKATMAAHITREGTYKGKLAYSAPEQLRGHATRRSDVYALSVMVWELLAGHRMHRACGEAELVATTLSGALPTIVEALAAEQQWDGMPADQRDQLMVLEPIVMRGLALAEGDRWGTAADMEEALANAVRPASANAVATWMRALGAEYLERQDGILAAEEQSWRRSARSTRTGVGLVPPRLPTTNSDAPSVSQTSVPLPIAPLRRGMYSLVALLSMLVVALAVGIVIVVTGSPHPRADAAPASPVSPATAAPVTTQPQPASAASAAKRPAEHVTPTTITTSPQAPRSELAIGNVEVQEVKSPPPAPAVAKPAPPPVRPAPRPRPAPQPVQRRVAEKPAAPKPPPEVARPDPAPADKQDKPAATSGSPRESCSPPYYYDGTKKVFKPACL